MMKLSKPLPRAIRSTDLRVLSRLSGSAVEGLMPMQIRGFFPFVRDHEMKDGRTFWEDAVYLMQEGVQYVSWMNDAWASLEGKIDSARFKAVTEKLWRQEIDASEWRDFYRGYWRANNGLDIPVDDGLLSIAVTFGAGENQKTFRGFDLSVDAFNKTQPGNLPNSDSRRTRYNNAGGSIADASGSPFSSMFVAVDKAYSLQIPSGVAKRITDQFEYCIILTNMI